MQIRIFSPALVNGVWHEPGVGNYAPELARHLISLGVAEAFETKVETPTYKKKDVVKPSQLLPPVQASKRATLTRSKAKRP